jgi:hemerythrin-like domain-containing protein
MNIIKDIEYNHDKIRKYLCDIEAMGRKKTALRKPLFDMLSKELLILHKAEEHTLYSEMEDNAQNPALIHKLEDENENIEALIKRMNKESTHDDEWHEDFETLKSLIFEHFKKEEEKLLPRAEKALSSVEEEEITSDFDDKKRALWKTKTVLDPTSPCDDFAKTVRAA